MAAIPRTYLPTPEMDDPSDLVLAMMGLAIAAVLLVAGTLYIVLTPDPLPLRTTPPGVMLSVPIS